MWGSSDGSAAPEDDRLAASLQWVQLACLGWIVLLPVSMGFVLYPALLLVFATSAALLARCRWRPSRGLLVAWGAYFAWVTAWLVVSAVWGNPGVVHQAALWLGVPVLWGTWALSQDPNQLRRTVRVLVAVGSVGAVLTIWLASSGVWDVPGLPGWLAAWQDSRVVVAPSGAIELNYLGLSSLLGTGALTIAAAVLPDQDDWLPARPWLAASATLHLVAASVSGRRGLLLALLVVGVVAGAVGLVRLISRRSGARSLVAYVGSLLGVAVAVLAFALTPVGTNLADFLDAVGSRVGVSLPTTDDGGRGTSTGGDGSSAEEQEVDSIAELSAESDRLRGQQFEELVEAWRESPAWGHGFGATLDTDFVRSQDRPWMFEAEPFQVLMNVGLLGLVFVMCPVILLLLGLVRVVRRDVHVRTCLSAAAVLGAIALACATNPYLQAPGHGWMLFLAGATVHATLSIRDGRGPRQDVAASRAGRSH